MICPRNLLSMADSDIIVSLHLVIPFISMITTNGFCSNDSCINYVFQGTSLLSIKLLITPFALMTLSLITFVLMAFVLSDYCSK